MPGFNAGLLLRFLLEKCRTVREALDPMKRLPIGSSHTMILADISGDIAVTECGSGTVEIWNPAPDCRSFLWEVNRFSLPPMIPKNQPGVDDWFSDLRYETMRQTFHCHGKTFDLSSAMKLLSGQYGFLCQYDRSAGKDTVWSVIYDLKQRRVFRREGNPGKGPFEEDCRFRSFRSIGGFISMAERGFCLSFSTEIKSAAPSFLPYKNSYKNRFKNFSRSSLGIGLSAAGSWSL